MEQAPESVPPSWLKIPKPIRKEERADSRSKKTKERKTAQTKKKRRLAGPDPYTKSRSQSSGQRMFERFDQRTVCRYEASGSRSVLGNRLPAQSPSKQSMDSAR